jgi:hypothetical protein
MAGWTMAGWVMSWRRRQLKFGFLGVLVATVVMLHAGQFWLPTAPAAAQQPYVSPESIATQFYQRVPNFPKLDQYKVSDPKVPNSSTLVERFVQYHTSVKGRSPLFRFDWKISLADYLGLNDFIDGRTYPGKSYLAINPMQDDRAALRQLTRPQRELLVQTLMNIFTRDSRAVSPAEPATPAPTASPTAVQPDPAVSERGKLQPLPQSSGAGKLAPPTPKSEPVAPRPRSGADLLRP